MNLFLFWQIVFPKKKGFLQKNIPFFQKKFIGVNFTTKKKTILTSDFSQPICYFLNQKKTEFFFLEFKQFLEKFINFLNSQNMEKVKKIKSKPTYDMTNSSTFM